MLTWETDDLCAAYGSLLRTVVEKGDLVRPRGLACREVRPLVVRLTQPSRCVINRPGFSRAFMYMDLAQVLAGKYDRGLFEAVSPAAAKLLTPYGAYGPRVWPQLELVEQELRRDPDSRRAVVYVGRPDDLFMAQHYPPESADAACVTEDTEVSGLLPSAVTKRWYEGKVVRLQTRSGKRLSVTPNHPVLSTRGWLAAKLLKKGDQVVGDFSGVKKGRPGVPTTQVNDNHVPPTAKNVFEALSKLAGKHVTAAGHTNDFHGDGRDGQVHVVAVNGFLDYGVEAPCLQGFVNQTFAVGRKPRVALTGEGGLEEAGGGRIRRNLSASGSADAGVGLRRPQPRSLAPVAELNAVAFEEAGQTVDAILPLQRGYRNPLFIHADELAPQYGELGAGALAASGWQLDELVDVSEVDYRGHVYNLHTETAWYLSNDIITHNCTMTWQFLIRGGRLEMIVNMRSWDLVWGLGYDVPTFVGVQQALASVLEVNVGTYTHVAGSGHVYEQHWDLPDKCFTEALTELSPMVDESWYWCGENPDGRSMMAVRRLAAAALSRARECVRGGYDAGPGGVVWCDPANPVWSRALTKWALTYERNQRAKAAW